MQWKCHRYVLTGTAQIPEDTVNTTGSVEYQEGRNLSAVWLHIEPTSRYQAPVGGEACRQVDMGNSSQL